MPPSGSAISLRGWRSKKRGAPGRPFRFAGRMKESFSGLMLMLAIACGMGWDAGVARHLTFMKTILLKLSVAACAIACLLPVTSVAGSPEPALNPKALASLKRMGDTLAAAKAFTYRSGAIFEVPAKNGQFLTLFSNADVALERPDKLRGRLTGEAPHFNFYYDGSTVSAFAPGTNVYSRAKAPGTIDAMLPALEEETGIRFVTAPFLFSNPYRVLSRNLTSALVVGQTMVHGTLCEHLAFRAPGINWEIWIESSPRALPRRLAVTFTDRPNFPRTLVEFSNWNLHPWLNSSGFVFNPPKGAAEIPFLSVLKSTGR